MTAAAFPGPARFTGTATWGTGAAAQTRTSAGSSDGFLARYLPDGTLERLLTVGGSESDDLRAVATVVPVRRELRSS